MVVHHALAKRLDLRTCRALYGHVPRLYFGQPSSRRLLHKGRVRVFRCLALGDRGLLCPPGQANGYQDSKEYPSLHRRLLLVRMWCSRWYAAGSLPGRIMQESLQKRGKIRASVSLPGGSAVVTAGPRYRADPQGGAIGARGGFRAGLLTPRPWTWDAGSLSD
jgi:hypothetical protein